MKFHGKGWLNPSRDKNEGKHRRTKVKTKQKQKTSPVAFHLCDPERCVQILYQKVKSDVQNEWDDNNKQQTTVYVSRRN